MSELVQDLCHQICSMNGIRQVCPSFDEACTKLIPSLGALDNARDALAALKVEPVKSPNPDLMVADGAKLAREWQASQSKTVGALRDGMRKRRSELRQARANAEEALAGFLTAAEAAQSARSAAVSRHFSDAEAAGQAAHEAIARVLGCDAGTIHASAHNLVQWYHAPLLAARRAGQALQSESEHLRRGVSLAAGMLGQLSHEAADDVQDA